VNAEDTPGIEVRWYRPVPREQVPCPAYGDCVAAVAAAALGLPSLAIRWAAPVHGFEGSGELRMNRLARLFGRPDAPLEDADPFYACKRADRALRGYATHALSVGVSPTVVVVAGQESWDLVETIGHEGCHVRQYRDGLLPAKARREEIDLAEQFAHRAGLNTGNLWRALLETTIAHRRLELAYMNEADAWRAERRSKGIPCL
jgi:hypothetical protein